MIKTLTQQRMIVLKCWLTVGCVIMSYTNLQDFQFSLCSTDENGMLNFIFRS